jgi:peptidoglycan-N-acetylglucosamine deacetylase
MDRRLFLGAAAGCALAQGGFSWPAGRKGAVSFSFDDARVSQVDTGLAVLERAQVKATFYLNPPAMHRRLEGWKKAVAAGHEIGNHSTSHPCSGNFKFSAKNALEDCTMPRLEKDLDDATAAIEQALGVKTVSFAYPCGQKYIGRGEKVQSYVPAIARRFLTGRGYLDESPNDPAFCDLANLLAAGGDGLGFEEMVKMVDAAMADGRWLIFAGHEMGKRGYQITDMEALEKLCAYMKAPERGIWVGTVGEIGRYIQKSRRSV